MLNYKTTTYRVQLNKLISSGETRSVEGSLILGKAIADKMKLSSATFNKEEFKSQLHDVMNKILRLIPMDVQILETKIEACYKMRLETAYPQLIPCVESDNSDLDFMWLIGGTTHISANEAILLSRKGSHKKYNLYSKILQEVLTDENL